VEDDEDQRAVLTETLEDANYYVTPLWRSPGALDSVRAQQPDLVITDVRMPDVDGIQILTRLAGVNYPGKVMVLSGFVRDGDHFEGADAVMAKPWDRDALLATVARLIGPAE
jgi:CheY-like chemotaxis protein